MIKEINFSEKAVERINQLISKKPSGTFFRIAVKGGGCSGFQYGFMFDKEKDDDLKVENGDVTVVIDPLSLQYLDRAEIDYSADNFSSQFVIRNPNVQATCGCGSSFAV